MATALPTVVVAKPVLLAASANRNSSCSTLLPPLSPASSSTLAFGSGKLVALWDTEGQGGVKELLRGHAGEVTAVEKLEVEDGRGFVSGDGKGEVRVWRSSVGADGAESWKSEAIPAHTKSISALATILRPRSEDSLLLSCSSDSTMKLWRIGRGRTKQDPGVELLDEISLGNRLGLAASISTLGHEDCIVVAVGMTDSKVSIYTLSSSNKLLLSVSLTGHTDWVRCLDFQPSSSPAGHTLLASGSQDSYVRLWRFTPAPSSSARTKVNGTSSNGSAGARDPFAALDALESSLSDAAGSSLTIKAQRIEMKKHAIRCGADEWGHVTAEAVLMGHENWVTDVRWCSSSLGRARLLSTSVDRSMILWEAPESADGLWLSADRFGELSVSTNLGFFGAHFSSSALADAEGDEETAMASGWGGAWHVWRRRRRREEQWSRWEPSVAPTGHYASVTGLDWDAQGEMLLTSSTDQTTRLWGPWRPSASSGDATWHELARPQVHGHDIFDVRFVRDRRTAFVSVGEEKVIRAFEATKAFVRSVGENGMRSLEVPLEEASPEAGGEGRAETAMVPALGLSNKVVNEAHGMEQAEDDVRVDEEVKEGLKHPPFEDQLLSSTLWPEVDKLFGHSSELLTIASSPTSSLFASACQSNTAKHASIRVWDSKTWRGVGKPLEFHTLSVTGLAWTGVEGKEKLVSVSRDRGWAVWTRGEDGQFVLAQGQEAAHTRIIYDVAWTPDGSVFATASRDKTAKVWAQSGHEWELKATLKFTVGARSLAFAPSSKPGQSLLLAVGLEDGRVAFFSSPVGTEETWTSAGELDPSLSHVDAVSRIAFCPRRPASSTGKEGETFRLATASDDKTVRIIDFSLPSAVPA